jgi:hypothetical protein
VGNARGFKRESGIKVELTCADCGETFSIDEDQLFDLMDLISYADHVSVSVSVEPSGGLS